MRGLAILLATLTAGAAQAQVFACTLADGRAAAFVVDPNLFVTAVSAEEPLRRRLTVVELGSAQFPAEPFRIGPFAGFHAEGMGGSQMMFVVDETGAARLTNARAGVDIAGTCEVR